MSMMSAQMAARQYAERPKDERFPSMEAFIQASAHDKNLSAERTYNLKDLRVVPATLSETLTLTQPGPQYDPRASQTRPDVHETLQLVGPKGPGLMTHWAFGQLCRTLGAPAGYLRSLPPGLTADNLNHGLASSGVGVTANLLVRVQNGTPYPLIRACTSETYGRLWDVDWASAAQQQIFTRKSSGTGHEWISPPTWTGEAAGTYKGDRDSFVIRVDGGSIVENPSRAIEDRNSGGRPMYRGIMVRNSEVGAAGLTIECILFDAICGNHILWGAIMDSQYRRRHVGKHVLRDTLTELYKIAYRWTQQSTERDKAIVDSLIRNEIASTRAAVIDELRKLGATADQAEGMYDRCERAETVSPRSYWGLAAGATRISQDSQYQDDRYQLDKLAATILARGAKLARV